MTTVPRGTDRLTFLQLLDRVLTSDARTRRARALVRTVSLSVAVTLAPFALLAVGLAFTGFVRVATAAVAVLGAAAGSVVAFTRRQRRKTTASQGRSGPPTDTGPG